MCPRLLMCPRRSVNQQEQEQEQEQEQQQQHSYQENGSELKNNSCFRARRTRGRNDGKEE